MRNKKRKLKAGHYEVLGETIAKFEFFENGWNPYSRFLDIEKVDLILRKKINEEITYREIQVKYGRLYEIKTKWEKALFDYTSWKIFKSDEFKGVEDNKNLFLAYILSCLEGYRGDIFIFPIKKFSELIKKAIEIKSKKGQELRKIYISRSCENKDRWYLRRKTKFEGIEEDSVIDVSMYRRNFKILESGV